MFSTNLAEYLGADPYGQPLSSLHHAPLHHYNQLTGLRPTQDQLGIHRTHREAELQGHVVGFYVYFGFSIINLLDKFYLTTNSEHTF